VVPWLEMGAGPYWVNPRLSGLILKDGSLEPTKPANSKFMLGAFGAAGISCKNGATRLGVGLTYDHLWSRNDFGSDFGAFALGLHVLFGK